MKFKLEFERTRRNKDGHIEHKYVHYHIGSAGELFDRMAAMRYLEGLRQITVRQRSGNGHRGVASVHANPTFYPTGVLRDEPVKFSPCVLYDIDLLEQFCVRLWETLGKEFKDYGDRSGVRQPWHLVGKGRGKKAN